MAFIAATKLSGSLGTILYNSMLNSGCASQSQRSCGHANSISSIGTVSDISCRLLPNLSISFTIIYIYIYLYIFFFLRLFKSKGNASLFFSHPFVGSIFNQLEE